MANRSKRPLPRRLGAGLWLPLLSLATAAAALTHCADQTRCSHSTECEDGQICSNVSDPEGEGVCVDPCDPRVAAQAPCAVDGGASDASKDGSSDSGSKDGGTGK
ncbi:MAG: hypothetical protein U0359_02140 [Byssovorax sp.]